MRRRGMKKREGVCKIVPRPIDADKTRFKPASEPGSTSTQASEGGFTPSVLNDPDPMDMISLPYELLRDLLRLFTMVNAAVISTQKEKSSSSEAHIHHLPPLERG